MGIQNLGDQNLRYQKKGSHYGMVYMCPLNMLDDMCVIMELQEPDLFTILTFKIYLLINFPRLFDDWNWTDFTKKNIIFIIPQQHFVVPGDIGLDQQSRQRDQALLILQMFLIGIRKNQGKLKRS